MTSNKLPIGAIIVIVAGAAFSAAVAGAYYVMASNLLSLSLPLTGLACIAAGIGLRALAVRLRAKVGG